MRESRYFHTRTLSWYSGGLYLVLETESNTGHPEGVEVRQNHDTQGTSAMAKHDEAWSLATRASCTDSWFKPV